MKTNETWRAGLQVRMTGVNNFSRAAAYLIDWYIASMLAGVPIVLISSSVLKTTDISQDLSRLPLPWSVLAGLLAIACYLGYYFVLELKVFPGQTFGKRLLRLKVVKEDGSDVDFKTIAKREILGMMIVEGYLANSSSYLRQVIQLFSPVNIMDMAVYFFGIISAVSVLLGMVSASRRMLHDYIGGTREISVKTEI